MSLKSASAHAEENPHVCSFVLLIVLVFQLFAALEPPRPAYFTYMAIRHLPNRVNLRLEVYAENICFVSVVCLLFFANKPLSYKVSVRHIVSFLPSVFCASERLRYAVLLISVPDCTYSLAAFASYLRYKI